MSVVNVPVPAAPEKTAYDKLVDAAKAAFKTCLKERGTKASRAALATAVEALGKAAAAEYV